ncbi:MAG: hypothetical protein ABJD68_16310, partial [Nakamurella sp.]
VAAAAVLAVGGTGLELAASHYGGPGHPDNAMMLPFHNNGPAGGPEQGLPDHQPHPPWEH